MINFLNLGLNYDICLSRKLPSEMIQDFISTAEPHSVRLNHFLFDTDSMDGGSVDGGPGRSYG